MRQPAPEPERERSDVTHRPEVVTDTSLEAGGGTTGAAPAAAEEDTPRKRRSFLTELPVLVLIAFVLALLLKTFLIQAFYIPSSSMEPTLEVSDRVLVNKTVYDVRDPRRGEVAVFTEHAEGTPDVGFFERITDVIGAGLGLPRSGERDFIKRIIGLPGETIEMHEGTVFIDGEPLPESTAANGGYLAAEDMSDFGPVEVPPGHYFMMGDNRPRSADSRVGLGTIPREDLIGRAFVVIWPLDNVSTLPIAEYEDASAARGPSGREVSHGRRGGSRTLRSRDGAGPLPRVPRRVGDVSLSGGDRTPLLSRE